MASAITREGGVCHLVPLDGLDLELRALAPDAVVLNYLRPGNDRLALQLLQADIAVFVLDTEGGVFPSLDRYTNLLSHDRELRRRITGYLSWGPKLAAHLASEGWFDDGQIVVTGTPRFDFYAKRWQRAAVDASGAGTHAGDRPMVLINGNFPVANPRFQTPEEEARMLVDRFGFDASDVRQWQQVQLGNLRDMAALANRLAGRYPDVAVVYRPHPFERTQTYERLLEARTNLRLVKDGSVDGWILRSSGVIQRGCTTALEAAIAGVVPLSPTWIVPHVEMPSAERVSIPADGSAELEALVGDAVRGTLELPGAQRTALDEIVADWFNVIDGAAHERVASAVLARTRSHDRTTHAGTSRRIGSEGNPRSNARRFLKTVLPPALRRLRRGRAETVWRRSEKEFDPEDVARLVEATRRAGAAAMAVDRPDGGYRLVHPFGRAVTLRKA